MLRSLYSGVSGMKNFQTKLDVIGNNIANVNTYGFKKGRATFKDAISQTTSPASAASANTGGKNPVQVGLGSSVATVDTIDTEASFENTGRTLDLAISGDGYFVLNDGGQDVYTRAGNFYLDNAGNLVNSDGLQVEDTAGKTITISSQTFDSYSINKSGQVLGVQKDGTEQTIGTIRVAKFPNPSGLTKIGGNLFTANGNSGAPNTTTTADAIGSTIQSGFLEMSNVDLTDEFTNLIVAQRGFQANARTITTSDEILQQLLDLKR